MDDMGHDYVYDALQPDAGTSRSRAPSPERPPSPTLVNLATPEEGSPRARPTQLTQPRTQPEPQQRAAAVVKSEPEPEAPLWPPKRRKSKAKKTVLPDTVPETDAEPEPAPASEHGALFLPEPEPESAPTPYRNTRSRSNSRKPSAPPPEPQQQTTSRVTRATSRERSLEPQTQTQASQGSNRRSQPQRAPPPSKRESKAARRGGAAAPRIAPTHKTELSVIDEATNEDGTSASALGGHARGEGLRPVMTETQSAREFDEVAGLVAPMDDSHVSMQVEVDADADAEPDPSLPLPPPNQLHKRLLQEQTQSRTKRPRGSERKRKYSADDQHSLDILTLASKRRSVGHEDDESPEQEQGMTQQLDPYQLLEAAGPEQRLSLGGMDAHEELFSPFKETVPAGNLSSGRRTRARSRQPREVFAAPGRGNFPQSTDIRTPRQGLRSPMISPTRSGHGTGGSRVRMPSMSSTDSFPQVGTTARARRGETEELKKYSSEFSPMPGSGAAAYLQNSPRARG
jgi:hypothetical protein